MAYGSIVDGVFDGKIHSSDGVFYVERAAKYFPRPDNSSDREAFHSIIYKEAHVVDPYEEHRTGYISLRSILRKSPPLIGKLIEAIRENITRGKKRCYIEE